MRSVSIVVRCDACETEIDEEADGSSILRFTSRGEERELEICDECLHGTFLQEARPVMNRRKRKSSEDKPFGCYCGKRFSTERGLSAHKTRQAHD